MLHASFRRHTTMTASAYGCRLSLLSIVLSQTQVFNTSTLHYGLLPFTLPKKWCHVMPYHVSSVLWHGSAQHAMPCHDKTCLNIDETSGAVSYQADTFCQCKRGISSYKCSCSGTCTNELMLPSLVFCITNTTIITKTQPFQSNGY